MNAFLGISSIIAFVVFLIKKSTAGITTHSTAGIRALALIGGIVCIVVASPAGAANSGNTYYRFGTTTIVCSGPWNDRVCQNLDDTIGGRIGANAARSLFCAVFGKDPQCRPADVPIVSPSEGSMHPFVIANVGDVPLTSLLERFAYNVPDSSGMHPAGEWFDLNGGFASLGRLPGGFQVTFNGAPCVVDFKLGFADGSSQERYVDTCSLPRLNVLATPPATECHTAGGGPCVDASPAPSPSPSAPS